MAERIRSVDANNAIAETSQMMVRSGRVFLAEGVRESNEIGLVESTILNPNERLNKKRLMNGMSLGLKNA